MQKLIGLVSLAVALSFPMIVSGPAFADEVVVEKKVTTTSPSGTIVIENPTTRTFTLKGHTEVYTAPPDFDLPAYSGKEVTVYVGPDKKVTRIEKKVIETD